MKTVAVMQPYFVPYAGYFRLIDQADTFVIYDCVQFPRRGYVHRNQLPNAAGVMEWLTLPLEKCPRETKIDSLRFPSDVAKRFREQLQSFPQVEDSVPSAIAEQLFAFEGKPSRYIGSLLMTISAYFGLEAEFVYSSELEIDPNLKAQDRILSIVSELKAERYVNAPGGKDLYDVAEFNAQGVELVVQDPFQGEHASILHRVCTESVDSILKDIR